MARTWELGADGKPVHWAGGRIRTDSEGVRVWVIEAKRDLKRYSISLEVNNEKDAEVELRLFDRDPETYQTASKAKEHKRHQDALQAASVVRMDEATISSYLAFLRGSRLDENGQPVLKRDKEGKLVLDGNGQPQEVPDPANHRREDHTRQTALHYLTKWSGFYAGRDVRTVELQEVQQQLNKWVTNRKDRIVYLKSFMSFLREARFLLKGKEDPTLDLKVPSSRPAKGKRAKVGGRKFYELDHVSRVYTEIQEVDGGEPETGQAVRDVYRLLACYGLHGKEVERLAKREGVVRPLSGHGEIAGTITFVHKSARVHVVSVDAKALAAAQRLQARGSAPVYSYLRNAVQAAAKRAGRKAIDLGTLRHSFATNAKNHGRQVKAHEAGVPATVVASVMGHQSTETYSRFYDGTEVPDMVVLPLKLEHPLDPLPMVRGRKHG